MKKTPKKPTVKRRKKAKTSLKKKSTLSGVIPKPKYKKGQFVYSHFNPTERRQINLVFVSKQRSREHKYRLTLSDALGMPKMSPWITESGLSKKKLK
jgi:hypothetical protein